MTEAQKRSLILVLRLTPLTEGHLCSDCLGTGADLVRTQEMRRREMGSGSWIRCWSCNGNGLDPAEYFKWSNRDMKSP